MEKRHNAGIGSRLAFLKRNDFGFRAQRIPDEHRLGHNQFIIAQIGHQRAKRRVTHRQTHHQRKSEGAVYENLPKLAGLRRLRIDVKRLRIMGHGREQQIVSLCDGAADLVLDPVAHKVERRGRPLRMGPTEYRLLKFLMESPGRVFSRNQLLDGVWGTGSDIELRTVDVHIRRLRKALEAFGYDRFIQTVRGTGYRFSTQVEALPADNQDATA